MKHKYLLSLLSIAALISIFGFKTIVTTSSPADQTDAIVKATTTFLNLLTAEQRAQVTFAFKQQDAATPAQMNRNGGPGGGGRPGNGNGGGGRGGRGGGFGGEQYGDALWSNFPVSFITRPGLQLGTMTTAQREAAMEVLHQLLSANGYEKVIEIMDAEQALVDGGSNGDGKDTYTIGIFGTPNNKTPWMVQFGGHHLGLNLIIAGSKGALTPSLTGAQPAIYQHNGKTVRALAKESDIGFDLLNALTDEQRRVAILNYRVGDLVLGPGHDNEVIVPEGLKGSSMTTKQKEILTSLITQWAGIINDAYSPERIKEIKAGLDDTYFAWSGPTTHEPNRNGSAYYRIQGPRVIIEFSPQGLGGDLTMHVHTIYRDPLNNYGKAFWTK